MVRSLLQRWWIENPSLLTCVKTIQNSAYGIVLTIFTHLRLVCIFQSAIFEVIGLPQSFNKEESSKKINSLISKPWYSQKNDLNVTTSLFKWYFWPKNENVNFLQNRSKPQNFWGFLTKILELKLVIEIWYNDFRTELNWI